MEMLVIYVNFLCFRKFYSSINNKKRRARVKNNSSSFQLVFCEGLRWRRNRFFFSQVLGIMVSSIYK